MLSIKLYNVTIIFLCITSKSFSVVKTKLLELQETIYNGLHYMIIADGFSNKITLFTFSYIMYEYLAPSLKHEVKKYKKSNLFYIFMNFSFSDWTQHKLFKFVRKFLSLNQKNIMNTQNNLFKSHFETLKENLNEI